MRKVKTNALQGKGFEVLYFVEKEVGQFPAKITISLL